MAIAIPCRILIRPSPPVPRDVLSPLLRAQVGVDQRRSEIRMAEGSAPAGRRSRAAVRLTSQAGQGVFPTTG
jgi:hypothetical protein